MTSMTDHVPPAELRRQAARTIRTHWEVPDWDRVPGVRVCEDCTDDGCERYKAAGVYLEKHGLDGIYAGE